MKKYTLQFGILFLFMTGLLAFAGCGSSVDHPEDESQEQNWEEGSGDLSDTVTTENVDAKNVMPAPSQDDDNTLYDNTSYALPSGKWFLHNGNGELGFGMPAGSMNPGEKWSIDFIAHDTNKVTMEKDVRIQLREVGQDFETRTVILDETVRINTIEGTENIMHGRVPSERDKAYVFSAQVLSEKDLVEDTLVSNIYVPPKEVNAALTIDQAVFETSTVEANIKVVNDGPTLLTLGTSYQIEKKIADTWRVVPLDLVFNDIGIAVKPRGNYEQEIQVDDLSPGIYRVVKTVWVDGLDEECKLGVEFKVT